METNARKSKQEFLVSTFGLLLLIAACSHPAVAQTNTLHDTGNVGIGTTSPASILTVQTTGTDSDGDKYLRIKSTNSFSGLMLDPGQAGDAGWLVMGGYPNAGDFTVREYGVANYFTIKKTTGYIGIGTATPAGTKLHIVHNTGNDATILAEAGASMSPAMEFKDGAATPNRWRIGSGWTTTTDGLFFIYDKRQSAARMIIDTSGNVGIGTASPTAKLHVYGSGNMAGIVQSTTAGAELDLISSATNYGSWGMGTGWSSAGVRSFYLYDNVASAARLMIDASGSVGIGTTTPSATLHVQGTGRFTGSLTVDGNINAKYQDVAEWVPASRALPAGTVVTLDPTKSNHVEASSHAYDTRVAGVVSAQPGITLGEKGVSKVLVATTGRVKVMVDAASGPIQVGDLLVTSDIAGVAKKSEPLLLGGVPIHRPGTLIGKALEPLAKGRGEILVLLSLQ